MSSADDREPRDPGDVASGEGTGAPPRAGVEVRNVVAGRDAFVTIVGRTALPFAAGLTTGALVPAGIIGLAVFAGFALFTYFYVRESQADRAVRQQQVFGCITGVIIGVCGAAATDACTGDPTTSSEAGPQTSSAPKTIAKPKPGTAPTANAAAKPEHADFSASPDGQISRVVAGTSGTASADNSRKAVVLSDTAEITAMLRNLNTGQALVIAVETCEEMISDYHVCRLRLPPGKYEVEFSSARHEPSAVHPLHSKQYLTIRAGGNEENHIVGYEGDPSHSTCIAVTLNLPEGEPLVIDSTYLPDDVQQTRTIEDDIFEWEPFAVEPDFGIHSVHLHYSPPAGRYYVAFPHVDGYQKPEDVFVTTQLLKSYRIGERDGERYVSSSYRCEALSGQYIAKD